MTADLRVTRWGKGAPIVCVHGYFARAEETFHAQRELADTSRHSALSTYGPGRR